MSVSRHNPSTVHTPAGAYSHVGISSGGSIAVISGQIAVDPDGDIVGEGDVEAQTGQVFRNLESILKDLGAQPSDILELRSFVVDTENLAGFRAGRDQAFARLFPDGGFPASTLVVVSGLASPELKVEIAATLRVAD